MLITGDRCAAQVGSNDDNSSGGGYAYRASKAALNISAPASSCPSLPFMHTVPEPRATAVALPACKKPFVCNPPLEMSETRQHQAVRE